MLLPQTPKRQTRIQTDMQKSEHNRGQERMKKKAKYFSSRMLNRMKGRKTSCTCFHGHVHHSRLEARHCAVIEDMLKKGEIIKIERQVNLRLVAGGIKLGRHIPDFIVTYPDGHREIIESKGFETADWLKKKKWTEQLYPELKYNVWRK